MNKDIVLFYYYSSHTTPKGCWLGLSGDVAHRNMFLHPSGSVIHFEFPTFEDHSYNSICNGKGVKSLIKQENENEKYMIFRTKDPDTGSNSIIGYYKIGMAYYQETSLFDDNGFIWGIKAKPPYLIKKGIIKSEYGSIGYLTSWNDPKWGDYLNKLIDEIETHEDISDQYQKETNHLISIFQDINKMDEWKKECKSCEQQNECKIYQYFKWYKNKHASDMFKVINNIYTSNIYSKNVLEDERKYPKIPLRIVYGE